MRLKGEWNRNLKIDEQSFSEIDKMTYEEMLGDVESKLGLKAAAYAKKLIEEIT